MTSFDILKLADRLESAGFTAAQAKGTASALLDALTADLATKRDIADLATKSDIVEVKVEIVGVKGEIVELKAEIVEV